jgi:hypothetical protein
VAVPDGVTVPPQCGGSSHDQVPLERASVRVLPDISGLIEHIAVERDIVDAVLLAVDVRSI